MMASGTLRFKNSVTVDGRITLEDRVSPLVLGQGTTGERPVSPSFGMVRANSTTGRVEFYESSGWKTILRREGDVMTGPLTLSGPPTSPLQAATKAYVDAATADIPVGTFLPLSGGTMTGNITLIGDPSSSLHPATKQYVDSADSALLVIAAAALPRTGGSMLGALTLSGAPTANLHAATKQYVDARVAKNGDTMTGYLTLVGDPENALHAATRQYVDAGNNNLLDALDAYLPKAGGTLTGPLILGENPTSPMQAATKEYVDSSSQGLTVKDPVLLASTIDVTITTPGASIGGETPTSGDRILLIGQTDPSENGIYIYNGSSTALTRSLDADDDSDIDTGMFIFVQSGDHAGNGYVLNTPSPIVLGTTDLSFVQFSGTGQITAGNGLTLVGTTLAVGGGTGIAVNSDDVALTGQALAFHQLSSNGLVVRTGAGTITSRTISGTSQRITISNGSGVSGDPTIDIDSSYVGQTSITTVGTIASGTWEGTPVAVEHGGTGATTASGARTALQAAAINNPTFQGIVTLPSGTTTDPALKFQAGDILDSPEVGAVEFNGTKMYLTIDIAGLPTRKEIAFSDGNITGTASNVSGIVQIINGGTGATTAEQARINLGLGTISTQDSDDVSITGGAISNTSIDTTALDGGSF